MLERKVNHPPTIDHAYNFTISLVVCLTLNIDKWIITAPINPDIIQLIKVTYDSILFSLLTLTMDLCK